MHRGRTTAQADPAAISTAGEQIAEGRQPGWTLHGRLSGVKVRNRGKTRNVRSLRIAADPRERPLSNLKPVFRASLQARWPGRTGIAPRCPLFNPSSSGTVGRAKLLEARGHFGCSRFRKPPRSLGRDGRKRNTMGRICRFGEIDRQCPASKRPVVSGFCERATRPVRSNPAVGSKIAVACSRHNQRVAVHFARFSWRHPPTSPRPISGRGRRIPGPRSG